jgi:Ca-activated chloride channel family protein
VAQRQAACDVIERNQVVLLSDGHANAGETRPQMLARHASELRKRGIVTSTVGVGHNYSPTQLQAIAEAGGGRMHDAEEPSDIAQIVMAELNDTLATVVDNLELSLTLPSGTQPEPYGTAPFTPAATGYDVLVGGMLGGATRRVVIKLKLPAGEAASTLAIGLSARWTVPGDNKRYACDVAVPALRFDSGNACLAQPRDIELAKKVVEQWVAHVYYRAMVLNQDGDGQAAMNFVEQETKYLHRYCAGVPELEAAIGGLDGFSSSVSHQYTAHTSKEMMLRAYKMGRGETSHRSRETHDFATLSAMEDAARKPPRSRRPDRDVK